MRGDILIIDDNHRKAAAEVVKIIFSEIEKSNKKFVISVAGESGAGKSEIAASIAEVLEKKGLKCFIFQQDDYFVYPPKTNAKTREKDINWVGVKEVKLDLIDEELKMIGEGQTKIEKPLVIFEEDRIDKETVDLADADVIIVEGTYTTALKNIDQKVFIDRNLFDTKASRLKRNREKQDEYLEKILTIEHEIISAHKALADVIITKDYNAIKL
jgi:uridine kinase